MPRDDLWRDLLIAGWSVFLTLMSRSAFDLWAEWVCL